LVSEPTQSGGPWSGGLGAPAVTNMAVTNENSEWWPGGASHDQRGLGMVAHGVVASESQP